MSESASTPPTPPEPSGEPATGLPRVSPDAAEEPPAEEIDNIVPTRGYQMTPMVALGGSAGSIVALQRFFEAMPPENGIVFVVILHLSPEHESTLAQLLGRSTSMRVMEARDGIKVEKNSVYVIPPGKHLTTVNGHLRLDALEPERGRRVAVDLFFRSLADTHGPHAAAIVLSGADADGAIGIKRIKERGGLTIAQDPDEAEHGGMPSAAINTGMVDWVLRAAEIPGRLLQYFAHERRVKLPPEDGPQPAAPAGTRSRTDDEEALREILSFLKARTGRDFSYYKRATIVRRISRRLQINGLEDLPTYLGFLRTHQGEAGALLQDLLISVTNFFRDREAFAALEEVIPQLFEHKTTEDAVRVWTPACATGEETYTLAMLLLEHARTLDAAPALQVFGCDLDEEAIQVARTGAYPDTIAADVSEERLRRFFTKEHGGYRVRREVREIVLFAQHDLLKDAPFSRLDLVSCRNLLIYLNRDAQQRAMDIFHFALRPHGILFLGSSESVEDGSPLFDVLDKAHRIFRQRHVHRVGLAVPAGPGTLVRALEAQERAKGTPVLPARGFGASELAAFTSQGGYETALSLSELHLRLVERFSPPSVLVNGDHEIVHLSEHAGRFLHLTGGEPSRNLPRIVHPALRADLHAALMQAADTGQTVEALHLAVTIAGEPCMLNLRVSPAGEIAPNYLLVVFDVEPGPADQQHGPPLQLSVESRPLVRQLEQEIEALRVRARSSAEQYEASTEELKASNEELQAMNEELRSASEELETSREELQSINEELTTVNHELKIKVDELGHANSDLHNLMNATAIATIFLDRDLRITRYTPSAVAIFHLIPTDVGRPLADLSRRIDYADLELDATQVIEQLTPVEREVGDHGKWFLVRLLPYRTVDDRIAGVVLTFVDVTERKRAEEVKAAELADTALLAELSARLVPEENRGRFFEEILSAAISLTGADAGTVQVYDPAAEQLVLLVTRGFDQKMTDRFHRVGAGGRTACGQALKSGERTFADFESIDTDEAVAMHVEAGYRSAQATPLLSRAGTPIGMLNTHWRSPLHRPSARQLRFLDLLARQAADLIEQRQVHEALRLNEQMLRAMADNLPGAAVFIVDTDLRYRLACGEAFAAAGFKPQDFLGRTVTDAIGPELAASHERNYRLALAGESFMDTHEAHGREFQTRGVPLRNEKGAVVGALAVSFDITERRRVEEALEASQTSLEQRVRERTAEVQRLFERLISAQEEERRRIARDIHDLLGQQMSALRMNLEVWQTKSSDYPALVESVSRTRRLAEELDQCIDSLTWNLHPAALDQFGLAPSLQNLVASWSERFGIAAEFSLVGSDGRLPVAIETNVYRLVQEALHNVMKHAKATHVAVSMTRTDAELLLRIEDNGRGFDQTTVTERAPGHLGLISMRERAALVGGQLDIDSQPGAGTKVLVCIPIAVGNSRPN